MDAQSVDQKTAGMLVKLLELLSKPGVAKAAQGLIEKERKENQKVKHTVKRYKTVILNTTCDHCGFTFRRLIKLETKGDSFSYIRNGQASIVHYKDVLDMMIVQATARRCDNCARFISTLSREELESRYLNILNHESATAIHPPKKPIQKVTEMFVDLEDEIIQENEIVPELNKEVVDCESI